eukprot:4439534-Amphidinium_carterae.2
MLYLKQQLLFFIAATKGMFLGIWFDDQIEQTQTLYAAGPLSEEIVESVDFWLAAIFIHAPEAHLIITFSTVSEGTHDDELPPDHRAMVHKRVSNHLDCLQQAVL